MTVLADLWGPLKAFVLGHEMATRRFQDKPLILMQSCCANQTVTAKCSRFKDAAYTSDGWFFIETKVAKFIYSDAKGGIIGAFKHILDKQTDDMNGQIMIIMDTMTKPNPKSLKTVKSFFFFFSPTSYL